jgi:hypothetical protein
MDDWKSFLLQYGYATDTPQFDNDGKQISEITIHNPERILNIDETEIARDSKKRNGNHSCNNVLINKSLPRPGVRASQGTGAHETLVAGMNGTYEPVPPFVIVSTSAEIEDNFKIDTGVLSSLPVVNVKFGMDEKQDMFCGHAVTKKGSMDTTLWPQYMQHILRLFPDVSPSNRVLLKLDGGPGKGNLGHLLAMHAMGVDFFPGYPNGSGYNQEADQVYSTFKPKMSTRCDFLEVKLNRELKLFDIGSLLDGDEDTAMEDRPFSWCFREESLRSACAKVGMFPLLTRASLADKRLRANQDEIDDEAGHDENPVAKQCAEVQAQHATAVAAGTAAGYDMTTLAAVKQPKKKRQSIERVTSGSLGDIVAAIKACPSKLSPGLLQVMIGTKAMNSREVMLGLLDRYAEAGKKVRDIAVRERDSANEALSACKELEDSFLPGGLTTEKVEKLTGNQLTTLLRCRHGAGAFGSVCCVWG